MFGSQIADFMSKWKEETQMIYVTNFSFTELFQQLFGILKFCLAPTLWFNLIIASVFGNTILDQIYLENDDDDDDDDDGRLNSLS